MVVRGAVGSIVLLVSVGVTLIIIATCGEGRDIYVDISYPYLDGDGSIDRPYTSIQQAIDNAVDGDCIYLFPGIYNETLVVDKSITIQGLDEENTIIWKNGSYKYTVEILADFVTLEDLTIKAAKGCYVAAIYIKSDNVIIQGNLINASGDIWALYLDSSDGDTIGGNRISGGKGIYVTSSINDVFTNNEITNSTVAGIKFLDSVNAIIYNNVFSYNLYGIYAQNCTGFNITNNTIRFHQVAGIGFYQGDSSVFSENVIEDNGCGIKLEASNCIISNNSFQDNDMAVLLQGSNNTIFDNTFTGSTICAVDASGVWSEGNVIYGNTFLRNREHAKGNGKNQWDNGEIGNYWDDYNDVDRDLDGIGDNPYHVPGGGVDRYPTGKFLKPPNKPEVISPRDGESNVGLSPVLKVKVTDPDSDSLSVYFYRASDNTLIAERHDIPSGGIASCTIHLPYDTVMAWYVVVNDSKLENVSDIWVFNTVPIPPTNDKPVSNPGGPYVGYVNDPIQFDGTKSYDPDGEIKFYRWNFGDGSGEILAEKPSHIYTKAGNYTVTLTVIDNNGTSDIATTYVVVKEKTTTNTPPIADPGGPYECKVNEEVIFDGSSSYDPDGNIVNYSWDFGDGSKGYGPIVTHLYNKSGTYTVTLVVTDDSGANSTKITYVAVHGAKKTPGPGILFTIVSIIVTVFLIKRNRKIK